MKQRFNRMELIGFTLTIIFGTLLHFVFEWSGNSPIVGAFAPVNESVWEHLKLIFTPYLLFTILEYFRFGNSLPNLLPGKALGVTLGMLSILVIYYTYKGILGVELMVLDILSFVVGTFVAYKVSHAFALYGKDFSSGWKIFSLGVLIAYALLFVTMTFYPLPIPLFYDFSQGIYGIA